MSIGSSTSGRKPDIVGNLTKFGGKRESWQKRLETALSSSQTPKTVLSIKQPSYQQPSSSHNEKIPSVDYQYDSDFSEASTSSASDPESEAADQKMLEKVPWFCRIPPKLETSQFVWRCPGCKVFQIDLLHVDEDKLEKIPKPYAEMLRTRNWQKIRDPELQMAFGYLVHNHYKEHMKASGSQFVTKDGKVMRSSYPFSTLISLGLGDHPKMAPGENAAKISKIE